MPRSYKHRASLWLNRLATDAGIDTTRLKHWEIYIEAVRALIRALGSDSSYPARMVQNTTRDWLEYLC